MVRSLVEVATLLCYSVVSVTSDVLLGMVPGGAGEYFGKS